MSFEGISRADHTKGNKGEKVKLPFGPNGESVTYKIKLLNMRGNERPEPPVMPWVAVDFTVMESEHPNVPEGFEAGNSWTVGGEWGHLGFNDLKAFLAIALDLDEAQARAIDRSVILYAISDDQPVKDKELLVTAHRKVKGPKSKNPGEVFTKFHFQKVP